MSISIITKSEDITINEAINNECIYDYINRVLEHFEDKNNITIAGESAGSSSVSAICSSPLAKNLFKRAIGESSSVVTIRAPHTYRRMKEALEVGNNILKEFKCSSVEELRKIPASKLVKTKSNRLT